MSPHMPPEPGGSFRDDGATGSAQPHRSPRAAHLMATLAEVADLLDDYDEPHWALRLSGILPDDVTGLRKLYPGCGDAEDFHAIYLTSRDGHWLSSKEEATVNERLSLLRAVVYMDARALVKGV